MVPQDRNARNPCQENRCTCVDSLHGGVSKRPGPGANSLKRPLARHGDTERSVSRFPCFHRRRVGRAVDITSTCSTCTLLRRGSHVPGFGLLPPTVTCARFSIVGIHISPVPDMSPVPDTSMLHGASTMTRTTHAPKLVLFLAACMCRSAADTGEYIVLGTIVCTPAC